MRPPSVSIALVIFLPFATSQISSLYHGLASLPQFSEIQGRHPDPSWIQSGNKFQGDIDGVDARILNHMGSTVMLNALKNKQLIWTDGIIPYEMDEAFTQGEVRVIERAFNSYKKRTCIRFKKRVNNEEDYLYITKGFGCYSQVGRTGGKQELSLGRGCIFHEIIVHELMHSVGFWHEHSRIDRDDYIRIKWENVLSGMRSQFDVISGALQDTLGEEYDYKSIMHYASNAFSKNGQNTIETTVDGFTDVIGSAVELSDMDVVKINKLYACSGPSSDKTIPTTTTTQPTTVATKRAKKPTPPSPIIVEATDSSETTTTQPRERIPFDSNELKRNSGSANKSACADHFLDCPNFKDYCKKISFFFVMKAYCPATCGHCRRQ
uniref:Metalloendopeptidase n=1 Tax=Panagrellus redivivus TaxID=6233 RepID=A0A7E4VUC2_PANRE